MLKLRKAVETDFDTFKILYENDSKTTDYQWLYYDYKAEIERREPTEEERAQLEREWGKDFLEILEQEYKNYSFERFKKDLESNFIYMIERKSEILGYISMFFCYNGKYKIAEWAMFDPKDDETKKEVIAMLLKLKLPRLREYSVCVTLNEPVIMFLTENGFVHSGSVKSGFLKLEVKK